MLGRSPAASVLGLGPAFQAAPAVPLRRPQAPVRAAQGQKRRAGSSNRGGGGRRGEALRCQRGGARHCRALTGLPAATGAAGRARQPGRSTREEAEAGAASRAAARAGWRGGHTRGRTHNQPSVEKPLWHSARRRPNSPDGRLALRTPVSTRPTCQQSRHASAAWTCVWAVAGRVWVHPDRVTAPETYTAGPRSPASTAALLRH